MLTFWANVIKSSTESFFEFVICNLKLPPYHLKIQSVELIFMVPAKFFKMFIEKEIIYVYFWHVWFYRIILGYKIQMSKKVIISNFNIFQKIYWLTEKLIQRHRFALQFFLCKVLVSNTIFDNQYLKPFFNQFY